MRADRRFNRFNNYLTAGPWTNSPGFTLIELMVAIAIIGIMAAAAVPAINGYLTRHALQYATDELYGDIQLARLRAAKFNRRCRILFNTPGLNQYTIQDIDNNNVWIANYKVVDLGKFRDIITLVNSPNGGDPPPFATLEFLSQGVVNPATLAPANSNSVYLTNRSNVDYYRMLVSVAGGIHTYRWNPSQNKWN